MKLMQCNPATIDSLPRVSGASGAGSCCGRGISNLRKVRFARPAKLMGDSAYGSAETLGWLVYEHGIEPHVTVFDKSARQDGTFSRDDFTYDHARDLCLCPGGKKLTTTGTLVNDNATMLYRASKHDCAECALKLKCCPNTPTRKVPRSIYEGARDMARQIAKSWEGRTSLRLRKKVEMLFAHLKRILKLDRLRLRGPNGARDEFLTGSHRPEPPEAGETDTDAELPASLKAKRDVPSTAPYERVRSNSIAAGLIQRNRPVSDIVVIALGMIYRTAVDR